MILEIAARWKEWDRGWAVCGIDYEHISFGPPDLPDSFGRTSDDPEWAGRKRWDLFGRQWRSDPIAASGVRRAPRHRPS